MLSKHLTFTATFAALLCFLTFDARLCAQTPPGAPASPGTIRRIGGEAEAAFTAKNYDEAVKKLNEYLTAVGTKKVEANDPMLEEIYFNIGLAQLLAEKHAEAEAAFRDCLRRYPRGEYASRNNLGIGRACILQNTEPKKKEAIEPLNVASKDPRFRSEAGLWLGQVYMDLKMHDEALKVFRSLMGSDVRTPQQTTAAVEVIGLLAASGKIDDLVPYLDRLSHQAGIRDAIAWYANQVIVKGDELAENEAYEAALAIYRSVPPRAQILEIQAHALDLMRKDETQLKKVVDTENKSEEPVTRQSKAAELLRSLTPAIAMAETASKSIEEMKDLDAAVLMRRGRCLFYLERFEEALVCFRTLRTKHTKATDAEHAAYAEIVILNKLSVSEEIKDKKDRARYVLEIKEKCDAFMSKFPESSSMQEVATLAGQVLVESGDWKEVGSFFRDLENRYPDSPSLESYVFYQGVALFLEGNFKESTPIFTRFLNEFKTSDRYETALYYMAMSCFFENKYKETLKACKEYLDKFPTGRYAGDMLYRLAFIDFNDKETNQDEKIIRDLGEYLEKKPDDLANGSMLCLMGDTYKRMKSKSEDRQKAEEENKANQDAALQCYRKAIQNENPENPQDDIIQYALDQASAILVQRKEWSAIAEMHSEFVKRRPDSQLALLCVAKIAQMKTREGKTAEALDMIAGAMASRIDNPSSEMVEFLIDELVKTSLAKKKRADIKIEEIDKQIVDTLSKISAGKENATTAARIHYAKARLAQALKDTKRSDLFLKGIATTNAADPSGLSPALLSVCGDILIKNGDLEAAERMFKRLAEKYRSSNFADAGPVGLAYVALARKEYELALTTFNQALESSAGISKFREANLGKLETLVALDRLDPAIALATEIVGDKTFRGEPAGKAYLILGDAYRKQAAKASGEQARDLMAKAHGTYQRVYIAYKSTPEICAEGYWQAYEVLKALGKEVEARNTLKELAAAEKLKGTKRQEEAKAKLSQTP